MRDVNGVHAADALVLLVEDGMRGGWVEFGVALGSGIPVYVEALR